MMGFAEVLSDHAGGTGLARSCIKSSSSLAGRGRGLTIDFNSPDRDRLSHGVLYKPVPGWANLADHLTDRCLWPDGGRVACVSLLRHRRMPTALMLPVICACDLLHVVSCSIYFTRSVARSGGKAFCIHFALRFGDARAEGPWVRAGCSKLDPVRQRQQTRGVFHPRAWPPN